MDGSIKTAIAICAADVPIWQLARLRRRLAGRGRTDNFSADWIPAFLADWRVETLLNTITHLGNSLLKRQGTDYVVSLQY